MDVLVSRRRYINGMTVLPLCDCPDSVLESVQRCYVAAQEDGPIMRAYGFTTEELSEYALFMALEARRYPWNCIAIDEDGNCASMFFTLPRIETVDYAHLSLTAQAHWSGVFLAVLEQVVKRTGSLDETVLCAVIGCSHPDLQTKGVHAVVNGLAMDLAYVYGRKFLWTFTSNPYAIQSVGKTQPHIQFATRMAQTIFKMPIAVSNNIVMPLLRGVGLMPTGSTCFFMSPAEVPAFKHVPNKVVAMMGPVSVPKGGRASAAMGAAMGEGERELLHPSESDAAAVVQQVNLRRQEEPLLRSAL